MVGHEYVSYNNYMGYTIISADGENWKMLEQLKDESGKVVTAISMAFALCHNSKDISKL